MYIWCMFDMNENSVMVISSTKLLQTKLVQSMVYACTYTQTSARAVGSGCSYGTKAGGGAHQENFTDGRTNHEGENEGKATGNGDGQPQTVS